MEKRKYGVIVLAAGRGKRMKSDVQKQFMLLEGKPVIYYSLAAFEKGAVGDIVLVTGAQELSFCRREVVERFGFSKVRSVISGGKERYHSVYEGLKELERLGYGENDIVLIHDGARPFVNDEIIERTKEDAARYGACVAGMPSKDTVKLADRDGFSETTPERDLVWTIQTPQAFSFPLVKAAYDKMMEREEYQRGITDDAMVVERMTGRRVKLTRGSYQNIKLTTPEDMAVAEAFIREK